MEDKKARIKVDCLGLAIVIAAITNGVSSIIRAIKVKPNNG